MSPKKKKIRALNLNLKKLKKLKNKKINFNFYIIILFFIMIVMALFSIANLITVIELKKQAEILLTNTGLTSHQDNQADNNQNDLETAEINNKIYSNVTAEPFFESHLIDMAKTDMRLDAVVNALTFQPVYELNYEGTCPEEYCGALESTKALTEKNGQIYYKENKLSLPSELKGKKILNFTFSQLNSKWIVGAVFNEDGQEIGYAYLFDGKKLTPLITNKIGPKIKTQYGHSGGRVSAGGNDKQFIILYVGYEGIGYLYNNGSWQDISTYFGLRVIDSGFKPKIILSDSGAKATWYICSADPAKGKLVKLWQNETDTIQGALDLSAILTDGQAICHFNGNKELNIYSKDSTYLFKDKGFDNSKNYQYQSLNMSDYVGKTIETVNLSSYIINAKPNSYTLSISADGNSWQVADNQKIDLSAAGSEDFFIKGDFNSGDIEYSPWFGGIKLISYTAKDQE